MRFRSSLLLACLAVATTACQSGSPTAGDHHHDADRRAATETRLAATADTRAAVVETAFEGMDLPAAVCVLVTPDGRTEFVPMGLTDPDAPRPVDPDSIFDIASMTKVITTVAALQLVEQGRVTLDEPLEPILPELRGIEIIAADGSRSAATRPITLRDLLRHTAGFGYAFNSPQIAAELEFDPATGWPVHEVAAEGEFDWGFEVRPRRVFESGTAWRYGRNIGIAGKLVERLSGRDLDTYFRENIFEPLGMDRSGFNPSPALLEDRVRMHVRDPGNGEPTPASPFRADHLESFYGGGYLYSTPRDYARFLQCLLAGGELDGARILAPATIDEMMTDQLPDGIRVVMEPVPGGPATRRSFNNEFDDGFGLGWAIETGEADGLRPAGVGYWSGAHNTYFTIDVERGVAILFFSQMQPFDDVAAYELYRTWEDEVYRAVLADDARSRGDLARAFRAEACGR
jgi:methyl acetate hydrolase